MPNLYLLSKHYFYLLNSDLKLTSKQKQMELKCNPQPKQRHGEEW